MSERIGLRQKLGRSLRHPIVVLNIVATALYLLANALFPKEFFDLRAWREGPIEQVSHGVLLVALMAWLWAVRRRTGAARWIAVVVTLYTLFLLLEEIDWGLVYGVDVGFQRLVGLPSLHQSQWRPRFFWEDKLYWIGAPLGFYFLTPWLPGLKRSAARHAPVLPRPVDAVAFVVVLGTFFIVDLFVKKSISSWQCVMYALIAHQGFLAGRSDAKMEST